MQKISISFIWGFIFFISCSDETVVPPIDISMYDSISMRVINNTDIIFSQILLAPCYFTPDNYFFDVNPLDTTEYYNYDCGFLETIVKGISEGNQQLNYEPLDFLNNLSAGNYDCVLTISNSSRLTASVKSSD